MRSIWPGIMAQRKCCAQCGALFTRPPSMFGPGKSFCSRGCYWESRRRPKSRCRDCGVVLSKPDYVRCRACQGEQPRPHKAERERPCLVCGRVLLSSPRRKYCSNRCYNAVRGQRPRFVEVSCSWCHGAFRRSAGAVKRNKRYHYCCKAHQVAHARGSVSPLYRGRRSSSRGPNWRERAERTRARFDHQCARCGKTQGENGRRLSVDHIIPWRLFTDHEAANSDDNLVPLCTSCHSKKTMRAERQMLVGNMTEFDLYRRRLTRPMLTCAPCRAAMVDEPVLAERSAAAAS